MSTVAKKVLMGSGAVAEAYEIEQSLIFDSGDQTSMTRTPGTAGNRKTWTFSTWIKPGDATATKSLLFGNSGGTGQSAYLMFRVQANAQLYVQIYNTGALQTNRMLRDTSAWYHIMLVFNTTLGTADDRMKIYINGVQETSFNLRENPDQNLDTVINSTSPTWVGSRATSLSMAFNGYMAETYLIDGAAKTPSDFGETNDDTGQWLPKEYSGSFGTNGFYLKFVSGAIGTDSSGNSNTMTVANVANYDVVTDTPTNNFATLNPAVSATSGMVLSEGNLHGVFRSASITNAQQAVSTIDIPAGSGKWYWEMRQTYTGLGFIMGIVPKGELPRMSYAGSLGYGYVNASGKKTINATETAYGTAWFTSGQTYIISCYYDSDNRKVGFKLNNTDQGYVSEDVTAGSYAAAFSNASGGSGSQPTTINFGQNGTFAGAVTAQGNADTNGIGDFYYAPPSGYKALCTANLPDPAIPLPSAQFNTVLYTGNGGTNAITGVGFQPDWVWAKVRDEAYSHGLFDAVRGVTKKLSSNLTNAEVTDSGLTAFGSDGFTMGSDAGMNGSSKTYVAWNWKANGSGSQNTDGSINSTATSANQTAGFSIVTYTGNNQAATVGHGLGVAPDLVIVKSIGGAGSWHVYNGVTSSDSENYYMLLDATTALTNSGTGTVPWNNTRATSSVFSVGGANASTNINTRTYVAYCFASKPSFSKVGIYTGNGSASGPFINTGFKPAWVLIKRTDAANDWLLFDNKRDVDNVASLRLFPNQSYADYTSARIDILSNGFKARATTNDTNANGGTYIYMAFAESPFKTANAR